MKMHFYLLFILIAISSCRSSGTSIIKEECEPFGCIDIYKYLALSTSPYSMTEDNFWFRVNVAHEHAKFTMPDFFNGGITASIKSLKNISSNDGLNENFDFAFITRKEKDTIYADLYRNLWTIKVNGNFEYYKDEKEELKNLLREYSGFFSDCWSY